MFNYWQKQQNQPLSPDILWARPENKALLPRVAIVGGSKQGFAKSAAIYQSLVKSGAGQSKLLLPNTLAPSVPKDNLDFIFCETTKTGAFDNSLYAKLSALKPSTDLFVISEDSGKESETTQSIHKLLNDDDCDLMFAGGAILCNDSYFDGLIDRHSKTTLVLDTGQLQKAAIRLPTHIAFKSSDGLIDIVKKLHELTKELQNIVLIVAFNETIILSSNGAVCSGKNKSSLESITGKLSSFYSKPLFNNFACSVYVPPKP